MSEERFWNTNESISTAKFVALDGAMTMRQAGRLLLKPVSALPEHFFDGGKARGLRSPGMMRGIREGI